MTKILDEELNVHNDENSTLHISSAPLELVVSDLHDQVISSCQSHFRDIGMVATLKQIPIQAAILKCFHDRTSHGSSCTFVIFGGYGSGESHSGVQKQLQEAFPERMNDLKSQAIGDGNGKREEMDLNMSNQGKVWAAYPPAVSPSGPIYLISCAAYPRGQSPNEQEHIKDMILRSMRLVRDFTH